MKKMKLISSVTCALMGMGTISIATATTIKSASSANSWNANTVYNSGCLLYTSYAADDLITIDLRV
ncbi:hypothetical protein IBF23_09195, partial [Francisella tularensis]|uniref:hypothetical protein n=1 Tax=Francisella tularensis TaxID=263 RepID=UPI001C0F0241